MIEPSSTHAPPAPTPKRKPPLITARGEATPTSTTNSSCRHCGSVLAPAGPRPIVDEGHVFCCAGCVAIHRALSSAGFDERFYGFRDLDLPAFSGRTRDRLAPSDESPLDGAVGDASPGPRTVVLEVAGIHCAGCLWLVERLPHFIPGILSARMDIRTGMLKLRYHPEQTGLEPVRQWLRPFGYEIRMAHPSTGGRLRLARERALLVKVGVCWALAGNIMLLAFAAYSGLSANIEPGLANGATWLSFALASASVLYGGSEFFAGAWAGLRAASQSRDPSALHMDLPLSIGILVGYAGSAHAAMSGGAQVWFDSIAVLIAALVTARWVQVRAVRWAGDTTRQLWTAVPRVARRVSETGIVEDVSIESLTVNDLVQVRSGEVVPVDGVVARGNSSVDSTLLSGESKPVTVGAGDVVFAGTINLHRSLLVRSQRWGETARVGGLIRWLDGREARPPIRAPEDRFAGVFVLGVLLLAATAAAFWGRTDPARAIQSVVALLVVSCPCALAMARPLSLSVGVARAARSGAFVRDGSVLQRLAKTRTIIFDKTGTLTEGRMSVVELAGDPLAVALAASLERLTDHPIGAAFERWSAANPGQARYARSAALTDTVPGAGIIGLVDGRRVEVGRPGWLPVCDPNLGSAVDRFAFSGLTPVAVAVDGVATAVVGIGDRIREEAPVVTDGLRRAGADLYLLSGDHDQVVASVGRVLNIDENHRLSGATPESKASFVCRHKGCVMIGDGFNDALAVSAADVGIAVGARAPSQVAADVLITGHGIQPVETVWIGAQKVMSAVRASMAISVAYNVAGAMLALAGLITPLVAAVAMPLSSLTVVALAVGHRSFEKRSPS